MAKKLLEKVRNLNLPEGEYAIFGSGPICVRGLRDNMGDVDLIVRQRLWNQYENNPVWKRVEKNGTIGLQFDGNDIEMWHTWYPGKWDVDKLIDEAEIIDGLPFVRLETVLKWKKMYGRKKDRKDVKLIENYTKQ